MENITELLDKYSTKITDDRVLCNPNIPNEKLKRAIKSYGQGVEKENVLLLLDASILGNCKAGFILTFENIYFKNLSMFEKSSILALKDIKTVQVDEKFETIFINGELYLDIGTDGVARKDLALMLRELGSLDRDDYTFVISYEEDLYGYTEETDNGDDQLCKEKTKKSATHAWTTFYFITSIVLFATIAYFADNEFFGILLVISTIPFFIITFGRKTPRNWKRLLGWIIIETIYNPFIGVPVWVAWIRKDNKSRYGDEVAFQQEKAEAQARREVLKERTRKVGTTLVALNAATEVYEKMTPEQREKALQAGLHLGALATLNPDKAKKIKSVITNLGTSEKGSGSNALERVQELNKLFKNQLISRQEYETKKAEILRQI